MKKFILLAVFGALLHAQSLVVGHIACKKERWLEDTLIFGKESDQKSLKSYLKMGRCFVISEPVQVKIVSQNAKTVQFFYHGFNYWSVPEAVNR